MNHELVEFSRAPWRWWLAHTAFYELHYLERGGEREGEGGREGEGEREGERERKVGGRTKRTSKRMRESGCS